MRGTQPNLPCVAPLNTVHHWSIVGAGHEGDSAPPSMCCSTQHCASVVDSGAHPPCVAPLNTVYQWWIRLVVNGDGSQPHPPLLGCTTLLMHKGGGRCEFRVLPFPSRFDEVREEQCALTILKCIS